MNAPLLTMRQALIAMAIVCIAIFIMMWAIRPAPADGRADGDTAPEYTAFRPWQEAWQCNDLRVTVTSPQLGIVNYDIAGSIWGGINFTFDGPRHQLYKGQWPCTLIR